MKAAHRAVASPKQRMMPGRALIAAPAIWRSAMLHHSGDFSGAGAQLHRRSRDLRPDLAGVRRRRGGLHPGLGALGRGLAPWQLWTRPSGAYAGVLLPALTINLATLLLSAVCVGGTFMVITMAGIREALRLGSAPASLARGDDRSVRDRQIAGP